ncbi:MAG: hypothetical protein HOJ77_05650, partial [Flavobacteriales bacterium]|nr:hypothetical protein [Flavobacteriales bacterium]
YYNLSIWYKLTEKTKYGAYLSIFGAVITLSLNLTLIPGIHLNFGSYYIPILGDVQLLLNIPELGFVGCAWATLICYFSMTVASYYIGKKHFPIPYQVKRIGLYLFNMLGIYFFIYFVPENILFNSLLLLGFIIFVYLLEKPKTIQKS